MQTRILHLSGSLPTYASLTIIN